MKKMTENNLRDAFSGESQAHMKYQVFAQKADEEGKPNTARLFRAISFAEQVHATNHMKTLGDLGDTMDNLQKAINEENFEVEEMYPVYDAVAKHQDEKNAIRSIHYAIEAEKIHSAMYAKARQTVQQDKDIAVGDIWICPICGYTVQDDAPETCPVCGTAKKKFIKF